MTFLARLILSASVSLIGWIQPMISFSQSQNYGDKLGTVEFQVSCNEAAARDMQRGLALLHHMMYSGAEEVFRSVIEANPDCAMGYWGAAMTFIHPLWPDVPNEAKMKEGLELLAKARPVAKDDKRTLLYLDAVEAYYRDGWTRTENARLASFDQGWSKVHAAFPDDLEAASFYALAHMAYEYSNIAASPSPEKDYAGLEKAGGIVEKVLAKIPDHPAAHHYIIHAYDMEGLADRALAVARNYGKIAPDVPHALHMPSHIFTRLGLWEESISWNIRSAASGLRYSHHGAISHHYFHAADYLTYAYLQKGDDKKAKEMLDELNGLEGKFHLSPATAYTLAAVPARYTLERQHWADAAQLPLIRAEEFEWGRFPQIEAIVHFARAVGAARSGDLSTAQKAFDKLAALRQQVKNVYWGYQVEIQQMAAQAWLQWQKGDQEAALKTMQRAAEMEASTYKHPITPGEVLPARELLADLLLELDRPEKALAEYQISLKRTPNRFNSLFGAGRAGETMGDKETATFYYGKLIEVAADSGSKREALEHAKAFVTLSEK